MSRASYGGDIFSPVKSSPSFDDGSSIGRESDFLEQLRDPFGGFGKTEIKKKNSHVPFLATEKVSSKDDFLSTEKTGRITEKKSKKDSSLKSDLNRLSHVTTRKSKTSSKSEKALGVIQENPLGLNDKVSKTRKRNFATVRSEVGIAEELVQESIKQNKPDSSLINRTNANKEIRSSKIKLNKEPSLSVDNPVDSNKRISSSKIRHDQKSPLALVNLADSNKIYQSKSEKCEGLSSVFNSADLKEELLTSKIRPNKDSSVSSIISADSSKALLPSDIKLSKDYVSPTLACLAFNLNVTPKKSDSNEALKEDQNHSKIAYPESDSEIPAKSSTAMEMPGFELFSDRSNLMLPVKVNPDKENCEESKIDHNLAAESFCCCSDSKSRQVQRYIEKLVKEEVSLEMMKVRQMFYLQHFQLLRYIDSNIVNFELQKTIEKLIEENGRLKNIIAAYRKT